MSPTLVLVVPVRDEGANLRSWWSAAEPHLPADAVVRLVYDRDDDDTLPVARELAAEGAAIELLRSRGSGVLDAIVTGLRSVEQGPVVLTMADLSDDLAELPRMLKEHSSGAAIVVASRYMPGGRQLGGPWFKGLLARWGSLALHRLASFPVHDATNSFRLYDAATIAGIPIESKGGFEIGLELTLKAWKGGAKVVEVPTTWRARERGVSRFELCRWLPQYALWWLRALAFGLCLRPVLQLALAALVAGSISIAPLARAWLDGQTVLHRDQTGQYEPLRWLIGAALREGRLPLWNPFCATGLPYLADLTHGALHPLSLVAALLFRDGGLEPLVGAFVFSAGIGAFVALRTLGATPVAALTGAVSYGLAGWTLSQTSNLVNLAGAGSMPWVVAGLRAAAGHRGPMSYALAALAVAAGALAGDVQALAMGTAIGLALALMTEGWRGSVIAFAAVAHGALLASIQLVPSWSHLPLTDRAFPLPDFEHAQWDLAPWRLLEFVTPGFFTVPSDGMGPAAVYMALGHHTLHALPFAESVFVGVAALLLAAVGVGSSRTGKVLLACGGMVLWLALGRHLGARAFQDLFPIAVGWRYGEKYLPEVVFCIAALVALGVDRLRADPVCARRWAPRAGVTAALLLFAWLVISPGSAGGLFAAIGAPEPLAIQDHLRHGLPHAFVAGGAITLIFLLFRARPTAAAACSAMVIAIAGISASSFALRPGDPAARLEVRRPPLKASEPGPRVLALGTPPGNAQRQDWNEIDQRNFGVGRALGPNTNARVRVDAFLVDAGLQPLRWLDVTEAFPFDFRLAGRFSVTHISLPANARAPPAGRLAYVDSEAGLYFWEVPHRPWASFSPEAVLVQDGRGALEALMESHSTGNSATVLEAEALPRLAPGAVLSARRGLERIELVAEAAGDALLVVNDAFWPGWRATIDGVETPIFPVDALVRGVPFPAGRHQLIMRYDPPEVRLGVHLSGLGLVLLAIVVALWRWRTARRPSTSA